MQYSAKSSSGGAFDIVGIAAVEQEIVG